MLGPPDNDNDDDNDNDNVVEVNETTVVAAGGDYADYQFLSEIINQKHLLIY